VRGVICSGCFPMVRCEWATGNLMFNDLPRRVCECTAAGHKFCIFSFSASFTHKSAIHAEMMNAD